MRYMAVIHFEEREHDEEMLARYSALVKELIEDGKFIDGNALEASDTATCVRRSAGKVVTTDGPYAETKEQLGGYFILDCENLDEAIEIASRIPDVLDETGVVEVRPVFEHP